MIKRIETGHTAPIDPARITAVEYDEHGNVEAVTIEYEANPMTYRELIAQEDELARKAREQMPIMHEETWTELEVIMRQLATDIVANFREMVGSD